MQRISIREINYAIRWIEIYTMDSAIHLLNNNWGQIYTCGRKATARPQENVCGLTEILTEEGKRKSNTQNSLRYIYIYIYIYIYKKQTKLIDIKFIQCGECYTLCNWSSLKIYWSTDA